MAQVRSLRSNDNLQLAHWPPVDPPTGRRQNNVPENNMADPVDNNAEAALEAVQNPGPVSTWTANPMTANFNPGTPQGQKIFDVKTRGLPEDKKFEITTMEGAGFRKYLLGKQAALGGVVTCLPIEINADGTVRVTANLIKQYQLISFDCVRREAYKRYVGDLAHNAALPQGPYVMQQLDPENSMADRATFYKQVDANVVHQLMVNSITATGYSNVIQGHEDEISYTCPVTGSIVVDGPSLLHLIWQKVDPSLTVNVETLRAKIESTKLHTYENNVDAMLTEIEDTYQRIRHMDATCESILRYSMTACLSGPCDDFNSFVKAIKGDVDAGIGPHASITFTRFVSAARNKYLNMVASKEYNKVDLRKQELLALTTKIAGMEAQLRQSTALATSGGGGGGTNATPGLDRHRLEGTQIERWRIVKQGASITVDGKIYWWCEHHIDPAGRWSGMYVAHKPEDHDAVVARRRAGRAKREKRRENSGDGGGTPAGNSLVISQKLKEVLCSKLMVSDEDADKICNDICSQPKE